MTLRELLFERIVFMIDEDELMQKYGLKEEEIAGLSDVDLLELYEDVNGLNGDLYE